MGMDVLISQGMFGEDDGQIQWYGIIATGNMPRESRPRQVGDPGYGLAGVAWGPGADTGEMKCLRPVGVLAQEGGLGRSGGRDWYTNGGGHV